MKPRKWYKQPYDSEIFEIECSERIPSGAAINGVTAVIYDEDGTDMSSTMIQGSPSYSGTKLYVQVKAGTSGQKYDLRVRFTMNNGEAAEDDITIHVREISI